MGTKRRKLVLVCIVMMNKVLILLIGFFTLVVGCQTPSQAQDASEVGSGTQAKTMRGHSDLEKELVLAKGEGILATKADVTSLLESPPPESENAWVPLSVIHEMQRRPIEGNHIWTALDAGRAKTEKELQLIVDDLGQLLALADDAASRKVIWNDSPKSDLHKRIYHVTRSIRRSFFALTARAELARSQGREKDALGDLDKIRNLARMTREIREGSGLPISQELWSFLQSRLITWVVADGPGSPWLDELESMNKEAEIIDPRRFLRVSLFYWLQQAENEHNRRDLRARKRRARTAPPPSDEYQPYLSARESFSDLEQRKLKMVESFRSIWRDLSTDWPNCLAGMESQVFTGTRDTHPALKTFVRYAMANPDSAVPFSIDGDHPFLPLGVMKSAIRRKVLVDAAIRVLRSRLPAEKVSLAGLADPLTGQKVVLENRAWASHFPKGSGRPPGIIIVKFEGEGQGSSVLIPVLHGR